MCHEKWIGFYFVFGSLHSYCSPGNWINNELTTKWVYTKYLQTNGISKWIHMRHTSHEKTTIDSKVRIKQKRFSRSNEKFTEIYSLCSSSEDLSFFHVRTLFIFSIFGFRTNKIDDRLPAFFPFSLPLGAMQNHKWYLFIYSLMHFATTSTCVHLERGTTDQWIIASCD